MKFEFKKRKIKMVGVRLDEDDFNAVEKISLKEELSKGEICGVLIREALKEYIKTNS